MRRPVFRRSAQGMALFPFLAVLICTMGSLIVLLVLVLQQSRKQADTAREEQAAAARAEEARQEEARAEERRRQREAIEDYAWKREMLENQRGGQLEKLATQRNELSHLEDHLRRLQDDFNRLRAEAQAIDKLAQDKSEKSQANTAELDKLKTDIVAKKVEIEAARKKLAAKPQSYAIIPHVGKTGTRRRPIYIECAEEGIILHPEGVVFLPADFEGPLGPGNPLDAALRTVREHWMSQPAAQREAEPYPLLLVRPNGAVAYSLARAAMKSWEEEFGYELIEAELKLDFPPPDPQLENLLDRTVKDARSRQAVLAASMPSRYKPRLAEALASSPNGGFTSPAYQDPDSARNPGGGTGIGSGSGGSGSGGSGRRCRRAAAASSR